MRKLRICHVVRFSRAMLSHFHARFTHPSHSGPFRSQKHCGSHPQTTVFPSPEEVEKHEKRMQPTAFEWAKWVKSNFARKRSLGDGYHMTLVYFTKVLTGLLTHIYLAFELTLENCMYGKSNKVRPSLRPHPPLYSHFEHSKVHSGGLDLSHWPWTHARETPLEFSRRGFKQQILELGCFVAWLMKRLI